MTGIDQKVFSGTIKTVEIAEELVETGPNEVCDRLSSEQLTLLLI